MIERLRVAIYISSINIGKYIVKLCHRHYSFCVILSLDATQENSTLGRLINHGTEKAKTANLLPKEVISSSGKHLVFIAREPIEPGTQLRYDYNDKNSGLTWLQEG